MFICKHRWSVLKTIYKDRSNWVTVERCRRCGLINQCQWCTEFVDGKFVTSCVRTIVTPVDKV